MKVVIDTASIPNLAFTSQIKLMSVLVSMEGEQVLLVLIYQALVANQQEIWCFIEELTAQFEESHIDEYNDVVSGDFNLDQMQCSSYYPAFKLFYTCKWRNIRSCLPQ